LSLVRKSASKKNIKKYKLCKYVLANQLKKAIRIMSCFKVAESGKMPHLIYIYQFTH